MILTCPACGHVSHDREFCDRCNLDLVGAGRSLPPARCPLAPGQDVTLTDDQIARLVSPECSVRLDSEGRGWRVHWISRNLWQEWQPRVEQRLEARAAALPPCRLLESEEGCWVVAEASGQTAAPWLTPASNHSIQDLALLEQFLDKLARALATLHDENFVWANFNPVAIEEAPAEVLRFTNLDLQVFQAGQDPEPLQAHPAFAAPEICRFHAADIGPATDVFHLSLLAYYWLIRLLPEGFPGNGLESFAHALPPLRVYAPDLPPGIVNVLSRGLALEPRQRFPCVTSFFSAFQSACRRARERLGSTGPVSWDIGVDSRAGRAKAARGHGNEDSVLIRQFSPSGSVLLAVADGITTCHVGSGALASMMTCMLLETSFGDRDSYNTFAEKIADVCRTGSVRLLDWARSKGYGPQLISGLDLMGSTLLAAWLEGNVLTLANVGDSRAYLIDGANVEQLTVDGDLASELLADGAAPEDVYGLGLVARGLRDCIGGCSVEADGTLQILEDYCRPKLYRLPLLPGDVVVLCSDGLIEEEVFLDPEKMGEIVRSHPHLSASALAEQLAEAAEALQRLPSALEPDGFGDNITCIVIKVSS